MSLMSFLKQAGEKLFGRGEAKEAQAVAQTAPTPENVQRLNEAAARAIAHYVLEMKLDVDGLAVSFDGARSEVTVSGKVPDQATREKVVLCCGNVEHVEAVVDRLVVVSAAPAAQYHEVVRGDTLGRIALKFYGDAGRYMAIFEANQPMLTHPDKIYPGQKLRIPPLG